MTVSRRGKRGNRAGGMRPSSRNGRVRQNAHSKNTAKTIDMRATGKRVHKEEWVIRLVTRIVGTQAGSGFVAADDAASDILLRLLNAGGFQWEEGAIISYVRAQASYFVREYCSRREKNECEFVFDGELVPIADLAGWVPSNQDTVCDAHRAEALLRAIPNQQRRALEILCDGGNPVDVAEEMGVAPWAAITLIKEGRDYIGRVDPLE